MSVWCGCAGLGCQPLRFEYLFDRSRDVEVAEMVRESWPGNEGHSNGGRPIVYKGRESGKWWVDAGGFREQQRGFKTWRAAMAFALRVPNEPDRRNAKRLGLVDR